ncbi:S-adenosyl-L-methionine-dependent methyltransferase [Biscogniauxia marginata]|nr:S-adenosyl-L-methionine-dependent methyltransferase [Biscogniauxia marginata]
MTTDSAATVNKSYFDELAATYDSRHARLIERLTRELQNRLDFIGVDWVSEDDDDGDDDDEGSEMEGETDGKKPRREVRLLDYACGTGMISRALAPYLTQCIGIDISDNMVAAYNTRARNQGLLPSEMHALQGDLLTTTTTTTDDLTSGNLSAPHLFGFDLAAVGGGFHHFGDPGLAARRLAERLRPGGVLVVVDFVEHGGGHHSHGGAHTVMHHGFSAERMREIFEDAGVGAGFGLEVMGRGFVGGGDVAWVEGAEDGESGCDGLDGKKGVLERQMFIARGTKV